MSVQKEFSKHFKYYNEYNLVQREACIFLYQQIKDKEFKTILELGCGSGQFINLIDWEYKYYLAVDFSSQMCQIHPKSKQIEVVCLDFDSLDFDRLIEPKYFDIFVALSSLQWSKNLDSLLSKLVIHTKNLAVAIFTNNTFKTLHSIADIVSPLQDAMYYVDTFSKYYKIEWEVKSYKLNFNNKKELFDYIKKSGVSGGEKLLDYKSAKKLYSQYNLKYLEFEVIFITSFDSLTNSGDKNKRNQKE